MGLNKHMMIDAGDLECEIEELREELDECDLASAERSSLVARITALEQRLVELDDVRRNYNRYLDGVLDGKPSPGVSPRFDDHRLAFKCIQSADKD